MHIEKTFCDNILGKLLDLPGKNKDSLNARLDLMKMHMHDKLQANLVGDKYVVPKAPSNLTLVKEEKLPRCCGAYVSLTDILPIFQDV